MKTLRAWVDEAKNWGLPALSTRRREGAGFRRVLTAPWDRVGSPQFFAGSAVFESACATLFGLEGSFDDGQGAFG
jgi:hypothetical protein